MIARLEANLAAVRLVKVLQAEGRAATPAEQETLARWSGWGAVSAVFKEKPGESRSLTRGREQLRELLSDEEYAAARRNTINAHYTSPALAQAMWDGLAALGFRGGRVLEPGCGAGTFIGLAPLGTAMVGVELDPVTAGVAAALYPHAQVRNEDFAGAQLPEGSFDAVIGNVPFGDIHMTDPQYNPGRRHPIHTHFLLKSAALARPGGLIALITSRYTMDGAGDEAVEARRKLAGLGELVAAVRLPSSAHRRTAGTNVVSDILVIRRFADGEQPPAGEPAWVQTVPVQVDGEQIPVNSYFADHPGMVLGEMTLGGARNAVDLRVNVPAGTSVADSVAQAMREAAAERAATAPRPAAPSPAKGQPPEGFLRAMPNGTFARLADGIFEPFTPQGGAAGAEELAALLSMRDTALALLDAELATSEDAGPVDELRADLNARYDAYTARWGAVNRHTRHPGLRDTPAGRELRVRLLAEGHARITGGKVEVTDPETRDRLAAAGHAALTATEEVRFGRTAAARAERQRLLDCGQARVTGGSLTLTDAGREWLLDNAADLGDAVKVTQRRPAQGGFRNDPFAVRVLALEKFDPETGTARKTDIMRHRVLLPRPAVEHADDPKDALAICMDRHARVRLDVIAGLLGIDSEEEARDRLGALVFRDPAEGRLVPAPEYLSGDVRSKLRQAREAAEDDPAYEANVEALTGVIPPDLGPAEIEARLGAVFITADEVQQFLRETLGDQRVTVTLGADGTWSVRGGDRHSNAATITWGTKARNAMSLAEHTLNRGGPVKVTYKDAEGKIHTDEEATAAAREKQAELADRFSGWAWEDLDRTRQICRRYNEAFNSIVLRSYDEVVLTLPGVNRDIKPFWWQQAAIARMIYEPTAGLFHDMGAGKTLEQIIGVMEQKRLGLIRKPVICVKNHLLEQFRDEFLWAYPQARILCADTDELQGEGRRQFIARCASENPDAIIMTRGAFESIPLTPEGHEAYLGYMKRMFAVHAEAVTSTVKEEETLLTEFEQRLRAYFDPDAQDDKEDGEEDQDRKKGKRKIEQDPAVCWEAIGADYVCIDESQDYNNLWTPSEEPGMAIDFVHRSIDLEMKLHATRARYGDRVCTLATGTPITNKIPQFYVLQRYLRPERLEKAGFAGFAPWAATFTEPEQRLEKRADGSFGWVTRMRLINVPELLLDLHYFGDFKDADDIGMQRPAIRGGKPEILGVAKVPELAAYYATLPERYNKAKGNSRAKEKKGLDTVVAVLGDGFRAAQDLRLVKARHGARPQLTDEPQKIDHIADDVYAEWLAHRDDAYPGDDGQPDPVKGSLQLVFCNEGVPKSDDWSLYEELRNLLAERGMPRQAIRFAHEAGTDRRKKARLFAACNAGHVAVVVGSTETMGVGTNVQRRCIGVHHVHPHWRPDYDAQEDARARRPGNLNSEVFIKKWITEGSFDTIRAQSCERKSVFLHVVKHRDPTVRSIEAPPDENRESYTEVAAVGAGEPLLIEKFQLESELQQLTRARRRHLNNQNALKVAEQQARAAVAAAEQTLRGIDAAAGRIVLTAGDQFSMTVNGLTYTARRDAGEELVSCLRAARARVPDGTCETQTVGALGGFPLLADLARDGREHTIILRLEHMPGAVLPFDHRKLPPGIGMVTRLENKLGGLDKLRAEQHAIIGRQRQELTQAQSAIGTPFPKQDALLATQKALDDIVTQLKGKGPEGAASATAPGPGGAQGSDGPGAGDRYGAVPAGSAQAGTSDGQHGQNPAPGQAPAADGYRDARADALEVLRGSAGDLVPDAEQFADYFARRYGRQDPGTWPLVMQAYDEEWLPRQPADHPLKQQPPRADETGEPAPAAGFTPLPPDASARPGVPQPGTVPTGTALPATGSSRDDGDSGAPQPGSGPLRDLASRHDDGRVPVVTAAAPPAPYQDSEEAQAARQAVFRAMGRFRDEVPPGERGPAAQRFFGAARAALARPVSSELQEARRGWATAADLATAALAEAGAGQDGEGPLPALARGAAAHSARLSAYHAAAAQAAPYPDADAFAAGEAAAEEAELAWLDTATGTWLRNLTGEQAHRGTLKDLRHAIQTVIGTSDAMTGFSGGPGDITLNQAVTRSEAAADAFYALQLTLRLDQYRDDADRDLLREMTAAAALHAARTRATRDTAADGVLAAAIPAARAARGATARTGTASRQTGGRDAAHQPGGAPPNASPEPGAASPSAGPAEVVGGPASSPGDSEDPGTGMTPEELGLVHPYTPQLDAMVAAALAERSITGPALVDMQNYEIAFDRWASEYLATVAAALRSAAAVSQPVPEWARAFLDDHDLAASLAAAAAQRVAVYVTADAAARQAAQPDDEARLMRTAVIQRNSSGRPDVEQVQAYLPRHYQVTGHTDDTITITGRDVAGWTLDGYVIPRLASGLITAREVKDEPARPYQDRDEADAGRKAISDTWHAWQQHAPAASRVPATQQLHAALNVAAARPDISEHGTGLRDWADAAGAAARALEETGAEWPGGDPLHAVARAIGAHAARLSAGQPPASPAVVPYPGAGEYLAGAETAEAALTAWHKSATGSRLWNLTDREIRGNRLYDLRRAARDVLHRFRYMSEVIQAGDPGLGQTAGNSAATAAACHRLQLTLRGGDYQDPADRQLLRDITLAATVHAARVKATLDAGHAAAITDAIPAARTARAAAADARRLQPGSQQPGHQAAGKRAGDAETDAAAGLVLEHGDGGTKLLGVTGGPNDDNLRTRIKKLGFKPSRDRSYWFLPRPWKRETRDWKVSQLKQALKDMKRPCTERGNRAAWEDDDPEMPAIEPGEPYRSGKQAMQGIRNITAAYHEVTDTPAGKRMFVYATASKMRSDTAELKAAIAALRNPASAGADRSVSGLVDLVTRVAVAAHALHRHLLIDKQKGDVFLPRLQALTDTARETAGRLAATSAALAERGMATLGDAVSEEQSTESGTPSEAPDQAVPGQVPETLFDLPGSPGDPGQSSLLEEPRGGPQPTAAEPEPAADLPPVRTGPLSSELADRPDRTASSQNRTNAGTADPGNPAGQVSDTGRASATAAAGADAEPEPGAPPGVPAEGPTDDIAGADDRAGGPPAREALRLFDDPPPGTTTQAAADDAAPAAGSDAAAPPTPALGPGADRSPVTQEPTGPPATQQSTAAAAARNDSDTTAPGASPDAEGSSPEADAAARLRALAAQHGLTVTADQVSPAITLTTVTDGDRIVLRHDDTSGTRADGIPTGLDETDAYLDAWRAYPGLPARALLDWVRRGPDDPTQLSLSAARAVAADCGLVAEPVRAAGQPFIVFRLPGRSETVLAGRPGSPAASTGLVTVPVPSIGVYLRAYRAAVEPRWLTAFGKRDEWAAQLTALAPYLINATSLYSAEARRHVDAAADAAALDDDRPVKDELRAAWAAAGPFAPAPDREAALVRVIGDVVSRYQQLTTDGARYAATITHASDPEWDWIYQYVRDHPDVLTAVTPTDEALKQRAADERAQAAAEGEALSEAALDAYGAGDYPAALALIDQGETADPGHTRWQQARAVILKKSAVPGDTPQPETAGPAAGAGEPPPQQAAAAAEPGAAGSSAAADTSPGADDGARPGEPSLLAVPAGREEGVRFFHNVAERYGLRVSAVIDTLQWWTVHLSTLDGGSGVLVANYDSRAGQWRAAGGTRLDPGQVATYLAARGEGDLQDAPAGATDPYTRIGQARADYHKALLAYRALHETKAGRFLVETLAGEKPRPDSNRPDAIALDAAYQAVSLGGWKAAFAGEAEEAAGRFATWAHAASAMAGNLAATRHRAGKFRAALDVFTLTAGHLASRTQATAEDHGAWARVFRGLPGSAQATGPAPGETTAPDDAQPVAATTTAPSGPAPADETGTQPGREEAAGDSPAGPAAAPPARKASEPRSYRLTRQWPDGTVRESSTAFTSLRAAAQAVAYTLADNGAADRKDAAAFASRLQDAAPGTTMTHPSGYSFTIRLVAAVAPLRNMDLGAELDRMPGEVFARWLSRGATPPAPGDLDYQRPGAGSWATAIADGIEITVNGPDVTRHGLVTWPQAASWIDKGVTPARLGISVAASRLSAFVERHRDQLAAAGTCDPGAVAAELAQIRGTAVAAIVEAARRSRGTAVPVPPALPGDPAWYTAVMITRPDRSVGKAENAALEWLTGLRTAIREPQPAAAAEVRAIIRRWTRFGGLPGLVRALDSPAAMRAWISGQASRLREGGYDSSGGCWYGSSPDGLIADRNGDDRAPVLIRWEEIPAWIQPGITSSHRGRLLAAADATTANARRRLTAAVHSNAGLAAPSEEEDKQAGRQLTEAIDAIWAAIEAAPPPSPADLENARHVYRDTGPVQPTLFGDPQQDSTPAQDTIRPAASRQPSPAPPRPAVRADAGRPTATASAPPAEDAWQDPPAHPSTGNRHTPSTGPAGQRPPGADHPEQDTAAKDQAARPSDADPARASGTPEQNPPAAEVPAPAGPARADYPEPAQTAATNSDLAVALRSVSDYELTGFLTLEKTPDGHGSRTNRAKGLPDADAHQELNFDRDGVRITVSSRRVRRHGQVSWRQVASWIDTGLTPARLGIITGASRLGMFTYAHRDQLIAAGKDNIDAAITELRQISNDAIEAALAAALAVRDADAPVPPASRGKPAYRTTAMLTRPDPAATAEENAALTRIAELESAIRGVQPLTAADIKSAVRWWIGDDLPEYARALASPESMRAWISRQAGGPASRPGKVSYDSALGRYYSAFPEGLRTRKGSGTQVTPYILWEEIPAWVQPGLTGSLRGQLLADVPGRDKEEPGSLREALDAAWAAIEAAPPPSPAELDNARHVYRGAIPAQPALFGNPPSDGKNTPRPAKARPARRDETPGTAADSAQGQPEPGRTAGIPGTPQGANANDTQAPPAAARQEPPPDSHGDSQAGNHGTAAPQNQPPAREPEADPDLPTSADSPAPGREPGSDPAAAQDAGASVETATADTAEAAQEQDIPAHPADTGNDRAPATGAGAAGDPGDADTAGKPAPEAGPSRDEPGSHPDTPPPGIPAPRPQAEPRQVELPGAARALTPALPDRPFVPGGPGTGPETAPDPAPSAGGPAPLTGDDIVLGVSRLPAFVLGELFHAADNGQPLGRVGYLLRSYAGERAAGEPDAGARETVTALPAGLRIEVAAPGGRRAGLVTWQQADDLLRPGATPARRQIVTRAWQAGISFTVADSSFRAVGEGRLAAAARDELTAIAGTVVGAILEAVRPAGRTGFSQPADEAALTGRIAELAASLPAAQPRPRTPAAEVTPGDIIGHYSYRFHPFLVTEPPRQAGDAVEITGSLTEPEPGEPAGPFTLTVPPAGRLGAVVTVIPVPARSLRPLFPGHQITAGADQPAALPGPGPVENNEAPSATALAPAGEPQPPQPRNQEETMPPAAPSTPTPPPAPEESGAAPQAPPAPATAPPRPATGRIRYADPAGSHSHTEAPGGGADGASLTEELERLLAALRERGGGADGSDFSDIRATFAAMRNALSLPAASQETGPEQPAPALVPAPEPAPAAASQPPRGEPGPAARFTDIRETFADLRDILGLPASGRHARGDGPPDDADAAVARALDQAAAEAQACARWYRDTPEWQRTMTVGRAARDLVIAIRDAAGDYWAEIRADVRVRGFARTLAARTALAVAGPAHLLAAGLDRAGLQGSRPWRAAWGLHRAATTFANRVMRYDPPGSPDRMREARRIIAGLAQRQDSPAQPGPGRHAAPQGANGTRAPNAADLAGDSFPVTVSRGNARQAAAAPAARTPVPASRPHASRRQ